MEKLSWIMRWAQCNHKGPLYKEEVVGSEARVREGYGTKTEVRERERERWRWYAAGFADEGKGEEPGTVGDL